MDIANKRKWLADRTAECKVIRENGFSTMTINDILYYFIYKLKGKKLNTANGWNKEGCDILKGETAWPFWGKSVKRTNAQGEEYEFFPINFLFDETQVVKRSQLINDRRARSWNAEKLTVDEIQSIVDFAEHTAARQNEERAANVETAKRLIL